MRHYRRRGMLPFAVAAQVPGLLGALGVEDKFAWRGGRNPIPARFAVDTPSPTYPPAVAMPDDRS